MLNTLLNAHVLLIIGAYALFAGASALGVTFLIQDRWLKQRQPMRLSVALPSLERLDQLVFWMISIAFPILSVSMILGALHAHQVWGHYWAWNPKETFALITWSIYLAFLVLRQVYGWRGRRSTYLSLVGFVLALVTYSAVYWVRFSH